MAPGSLDQSPMSEPAQKTPAGAGGFGLSDDGSEEVSRPDPELKRLIIYAMELNNLVC